MQLLEALPKLISWAIPLIILAVIILPQAIRILREYERGVIFRLGKLLGAKGPGLIFSSRLSIEWCEWTCASSPSASRAGGDDA
jgi:hypothetical protein